MSWNPTIDYPKQHARARYLLRLQEGTGSVSEATGLSKTTVSKIKRDMKQEAIQAKLAKQANK